MPHSVTKGNKIHSSAGDLTSTNSHSRCDITLWVPQESASPKFVPHEHNSLLNFRGKSLEIKLLQKITKFNNSEKVLQNRTARTLGRWNSNVHRQRSAPSITNPAMTDNSIWTQMYVTMLPPSALFVASANVRTKLNVSMKYIGRKQRDFVWKGSCWSLA